MKRIVPVVVAVIIAVGLGARVSADTVTLAARQDNTLYENATGAISNGAGDYLFVGRTAEAVNALRRALVAFDLGDIPRGSTVLRARLTLHMSRTIVGATDVTLHRALADWGEGASDANGEEGTGIAAEADDATWVHARLPNDMWSNPGGDFVASPSATTSVNAEDSYSWESDGLTADVQAWVNAAAENYGWLIRADEDAVSAKRLDSRENPTAANRPTLEVEFRPPPTVPALSLWGAGALAVLGIALGGKLLRGRGRHALGCR